MTIPTRPRGAYPLPRINMWSTLFHLRSTYLIVAIATLFLGCHQERDPVVVYDVYPPAQNQYPQQAQADQYQPQPPQSDYIPAPTPPVQEPTPEQQTAPAPDDQADTSVTSSMRMGIAKLAANVQKFTMFLYGSDATVDQCQELVKNSYDLAAWIAKNSSDSSDEEQRWFVKILKDATSDAAKDMLARGLCDPSVARAARQ